MSVATDRVVFTRRFELKENMNTYASAENFPEPLA